MSPPVRNILNDFHDWPAGRMREVLNAVGDAVVVTDRQGGLVFCNDSAADLLAIKPEASSAAVWTKVRQLRTADGLRPCEQGRSPWERAAAGHEVSGEDWLLSTQDRPSPLRVRIRATPLRGDDDAIDAVVVEIRDLTEARRAEDDRTERRLLALAESSPDAIVIIDADGDIILANSAAETIFGYTRDELLGLKVEALVPFRYRDKHPRLRHRFLEGPRRRTMAAAIELWGLRKGGVEFPAEISLNALEAQDRAVVCCAIRDLTDRKRVERKIRDQQAELAHTTRLSTMGELATGLAHELNQPLTAIAAFADGTALRLKQGAANVEDVVEAVERIASDAHRAGEIMRRLRQFVRKRETDMVSVDLNSLVQEVFRFLDHEIARRRVVVDFELEQRLPAVKADPVEIQQVVLNLVRNAMDALMRNEPEQRKCRATTAVAEPGRAALSIEDSGTGISENLREQVFEPFYTSKDEGLGMGLAISRSIIEAHRGQILLDQSSLGGLCVRVVLPVAEEREGERR